MACSRARMRRGQSLVEFALSVSTLLLLLGAVFDLGSLLNDHLSVVSASHQAALAAAVAGTSAQADCNALAAVSLATQNALGLTVTRVVIYEAGSDGLPLGGAGSVSYADVYLGNPGCPNAASPPIAQPANWPPTLRSAAYPNANSLGVEVDYTYTWQMTLIAVGTLSVTDHTVMPITPG